MRLGVFARPTSAAWGLERPLFGYPRLLCPSGRGLQADHQGECGYFGDGEKPQKNALARCFLNKTESGVRPSVVEGKFQADLTIPASLIDSACEVAKEEARNAELRKVEPQQLVLGG